jgi:hypothetical protein
VPPNFVVFFSQWTNLIGPSLKKVKLWRLPKKKVLFWSIEFLSPLWPTHIRWKEDNNLPKHMGLKWGAMENMLGNTLGTWATYWEPIENLKGTHWEQGKNEKKNPSSSQQSLRWAPNSNLIQFPWPQGISLLQNGPFCEAEGPMPDFAGLHGGV